MNPSPLVNLSSRLNRSHPVTGRLPAHVRQLPATRRRPEHRRPRARCRAQSSAAHVCRTPSSPTLIPAFASRRNQVSPLAPHSHPALLFRLESSLRCCSCAMSRTAVPATGAAATRLWPHLLEQCPSIELPTTKSSLQEVTKTEPTPSTPAVRAPHRRPRTSGRSPTQPTMPRALPHPHAAHRQL
jgi:hypothetical protein